MSNGAIRPATPAVIAEAAALLRAGALVAFPTETVYGLGADAGNDRAVAGIFAAKGRPRFNPLIVHVADAEAAAALTVFNDRARLLAEHFWPGPLTLVLRRRADARLSLLVSAGLDTVAVRAPDHPVAQALLHAAAVPIAAPSANPSGRLSPTRAEHVAAGLAFRVAAILDGGPSLIGIESTVLDLTGRQPAILRPGGLTEEAIAAVAGPLVPPDARLVRSPGLLAHHYAPDRPLRLDARETRPDEALLAFGPAVPDGAVLNLSPAGDLAEAAANLFAMLRALDRPEASGIAVMPIPHHGLGIAINDRLTRAAARDDGPPGRNDDWNDERGPASPCVLPGIAEGD